MSDHELLLDYLTVKAAYQPKAIPTRNAWTFFSKMTGIPQVWTLDEQQQPVPFAQADDRILSIHHSPKGDPRIL
ncbi:hypothetical protein [Paenibacillus caui]|uniref:hypothetical protein n=1 Tax=Paenibacillus caui TaxID=2873927 RepID=UPI001CA8132A|nr:hypothetical protein [Paenibacillus caui]